VFRLRITIRLIENVKRRLQCTLSCVMVNFEKSKYNRVSNKMNFIPYIESRIFMSFYVWCNACRKHIRLFLEDVSVSRNAFGANQWSCI